MSVLKTSELVIHDGTKTRCKLASATVTVDPGSTIYTDDNGDLADEVVMTEPATCTITVQGVGYKKSKVKASITWDAGWGTLGVLAIHMEKS